MRKVILSLFVLLNFVCIVKIPVWTEQRETESLNSFSAQFPVPVPYKRTVEEIELEQAIIVRDYYKKRHDKIKHVDGVAGKDIEELHMKLKVSELEVEKAEIKLHKF